MPEPYTQQVKSELEHWERTVLKRSGFLESASKRVQVKINGLLPQRMQQAVTLTVKTLVKAVLFGLDFVPKGQPRQGLSLEARDRLAFELVERYQKIAAAEGAGTGAGGIFLGIADFPALIAIKMKFLFELAHIYGFDTKDYHERLFLLYIFQVAFSSSEKRKELYWTIANWERFVAGWPHETEYLQNINWEDFQREYRDAIDFRKMLQFLPGIGAVAGAWANYGLMHDLGTTGINAFRLRLLSGTQPGET